jgi:hypothetical protein
MILICGSLADSVTELVCARLEDCGYEYRFLDLERYPEGHTVDFEWKNAQVDGFFTGPGWRVELDELTGVYPRFLGTQGRGLLPDVPAALRPAIYSEAESGLVALFEYLPCAVVNRLRGGMSNNSKPYQGLLLAECGLRTPETLVTNDPDEAAAFVEACSGEVIYKSLSGIRSIVRRLSQEHLTRLPLLRHGPAQFQRFVPGTNVRVHVVGDRLFTTRVRSDAVDYRYAHQDGKDCELEPAELDPEVAAACLRAAQRFDLLIAGIDLKITPDGEVFCFEINPSPTFNYYELSTGQAISLALAELLHRGLPHAANRNPPALQALAEPALAFGAKD